MLTESTKKYIQKQIDDGFIECELPMYMKEPVENWVFHGIPGGGFLTALLTNNLKETFTRADSNNKRKVYNWVRFIIWSLPSSCQGSEEKVNNWMEQHKAHVED